MKKSDMVRGMLFGAEFFTELHKEVIKLGGSEDNMFEKMKTGTGLAKDVAKLIVSGAKQLTLKSLKLVADNITVATELFTKKSFFVMGGHVKLYFWDNFTKWILPVLPDSVPMFEGKLLKTELTKSMYDSAILEELGQPRPFTVGEFAALIRSLLMKQPDGKGGILLTNGYANIFYVQLEDRTVAVNVFWSSDYREWNLDALDMDADGRWSDGYCVFSRS